MAKTVTKKVTKLKQPKTVKVKAEAALAIVPPQALTWQQTGDSVLGQLASELSGPVETPRLAEINVQLKTWTDDLEALHKNTKDRLLKVVQSAGTVKTEKGSMELEASGWKMEMRPWRTGFDEKKVETLLRGHGLEPEIHMQQSITYKVDLVKLELLKQNGRLTEDELNLAKYDIKWVLQTPKKVRSGDE